ncbi:HhH-GPD family protein [Chlorobaculum parvum NCIB 8327]|uniref:HhH-GPD family protein n=1 Tax=Chlorobaculum parvum (strain DSM 263 / NCIMB 8327) TaxID=517417 RepID=B3QNL0_CHLP8|nr:(Fe-S)-cluster assembly protein [Chlorobaculum parvum]ACF11513.1 HhH-GPD family protein [Chlorobaculum parvum NCIB 8327]
MNVTFVESFQSKILEFYQQNRRSFPWRMTTDRYAIMVSEVMLQQTQADRVARRFPLWLERFPDVQTLASASLREVLDAWSGLGYNSRGQRLHRAAAMVVEQFDGCVPSDPARLIELPGIGAYTSRSIPVFADNLDLAAVDTNIRRVLIHELNLPESITPKALLAVAEEVLPKGRSRDWHNALMDYGAMELTGRKTGIAPLTRQSTFKGSRRWYRSALLRELLKSGELSREAVEERYADCPYGIGTIVDMLVEEAMIEEYGEQRMLRIAGESGGGGGK